MNTESHCFSDEVSNGSVSERECRGASRDIEWFVQNNFMAVPESLLSAASPAWLSLQVAAKPDNQTEPGVKMHRATMTKFHDELGAWAASKG